jgi:hypothetical protein
MSDKREPLLSDDEIERYADWMYTIPSRYEASRALKYAKGIYEAARAKDAERIEQLEALCRAVGNGLDEMMRPANMECDGAYCTGCWKDINGQLVKLLFAAGFKPTE